MRSPIKQLLCAFVAASSLLTSRSGAEERLSAAGVADPTAVPIAAPAPQPIAARRRADDRYFPALGATSIAGQTVYPYRFDGHVHTSHSRDAFHPTAEILGAAERLGLDALVITDHGVTRAQLDFPNYHGKLVPFVGREIGGEFGHAVMWNVKDDAFQVPFLTSLRTRAEFAHARGGLLVFAHPGWWIDGNDQNPMQWMTPEAMRRGGIAGDVDAIELWNGVYWGPLPRLINAWVRLLDQGVYVPIVGNSDFHRFGSHRIGNAHNIALCDRPDVSTCLWPAVREGRIIVTDGPGALFSVNDRLPGSIVDPAGAPLRVTVDVLAPQGGTLRVYLGAEVVHTVALTPGERRQASLQIDAPAFDSHVRIDIVRPARVPNLPSISLLSNPVLIDVAPARESWR